MIVFLIGMTCFIFALIFFLKRYSFKTFIFQKASHIDVVSIRRLDPKNSVAIVEIQGQWLVLGIGSENITLLSKIDKPMEKSDTIEHKKGELSDSSIKH